MVLDTESNGQKERR
uniref:Uncharacterized protein n=1 Tax=Arundo donax TaxID=35708 RepID=A0A0A9AKN2_ARUDO